MIILIGQTLIIIGLVCMTIGINNKLAEKLGIAKGNYVDVVDHKYIGTDGKTQKKISYLIIRDEKDVGKFDINTVAPFEIKERK